MPWQDKLQNHPIFLYSPTNHPSSVIAICEQEVFVACGREIRYTADILHEEYIVLSTKIDFDIQEIILNSSRTLLVVVGTGVSVIYIPRATALKQRAQLKSQKLGSIQDVVQVLIHPSCASDNSILVLTRDSLRLYDLNLSFEDAEIVVDFPKRGRFDYNETYPAAMCLGTDGDGWTAFSVFILMKNGDVYVVCPILPRDATLSHAAITAFETFAENEVATASAVSYSRLLQAIERGSRTVNGVAFVRPPRLQSPTLVGPLLLSPAPVEVSTREPEATSIAFIPYQPLAMLAISYDEKVDIGFLADPVLPKIGQQTVISIHETIKLPERRNCRLFVKESRLFLSHSDGIVEIDTSAVIDELIESFESGAQQVRSTANDGISSDAKVLLDSANSSICGIDILEVDLASFMVVLRNSYNVEIIKISQEIVEEVIEETLQAPKYQNLLSQPAYRPTITRGPKIVVPGDITTISSDIPTLQFMAKFVQQLRKDMEVLMNAIISLHRRLELQQREYARQQTKLDDMRRSIDSLHAPTDRLQRAKSQQTQLEQRAKQLLQSLISTNSPELSDAEKRYFQELRRIESHVRGQAGILRRLESTTLQFNDFRATIPDKVSETVESPLRSKQLGKIKDQIAGADELLSKSRHKLERLIRLS